MIVSVREQWHITVCDSLLANSIVCYFFWPIKFRFSQPTDQSDVSLFYSKGELRRHLKPQTKHFHQLSRGAERCKKHGSFKHERRNRKKNSTDKQWLFKRGQEENPLQDWRPSRSLRNEVIAVFASWAQSEHRNCEQHPVGPTNPRGTNMKK